MSVWLWTLSGKNMQDLRNIDVMTDNILFDPQVPLKKTERMVNSLIVYCETLFHNKLHMKNCSLSPTYSIPKIKSFAQLKQKVSQ